MPRRGACRIANSIALKKLLAQLELFGDRLIPIAISGMQVIQQAAALAYHHQQTTTRTVVLLVALQVFGQPIDAVCQERNLNISRAGIFFMQPKALNNFRLLYLCTHFLLLIGGN